MIIEIRAHEQKSICQLNLSCSVFCYFAPLEPNSVLLFNCLDVKLTIKSYQIQIQIQLLNHIKFKGNFFCSPKILRELLKTVEITAHTLSCAIEINHFQTTLRHISKKKIMNRKLIYICEKRINLYSLSTFVTS